MFSSALSRILLIVSLIAAMLFAPIVEASFHLWQLNEIYSNASGTVQYIELTTPSGGQQFLMGHAITATQGANTHTYNFQTDLPGDTANRKFLIATQGFANLGIVTPDYVVPNGFLFLGNGSVNYAGVDSISYSALPTDGVHGLNHAGASVVNAPINFAGASGTVASVAAQALFVHASTSANKTSVIRIVNTGGSAGMLGASAYDELGTALGSAGLGAIAANQTLTFSSANLEQQLNFVPAAPTAKYAVYFDAALPSFQLINYTRDNATGALTLSQAQYVDRSASAAASVTRSAWFVSSSTSSNKTNVLRLINTSTQSGALSATLFDEDGNQFGAGNTALGTINARQMVSYTSAQLESALGLTPISPTAKYRVVFSATVPSLELINFTKDIATGNLALVQAQTDDRPSSSATTSMRNVLLVNPSTSTERITVLRIVNPNATSASVSATAYSEAGSVAGSGTLGTVAANAILALTSAQIETALGYTPSSSSAKYRLVLTADVPTFEAIDNTKLPSNGNLYLAQAQTDNRAASSATTTTRNVYIVYPLSNASRTTELRVTNTTGASAALTATAYEDSGTLIASNRPMGTLDANQMLSFTSAQLESLFAYMPPSSTTRWRIVFSANLGNFEMVNYSKDVASGLLVLAQPQTE
jgi:hypothetical protein